MRNYNEIIEFSNINIAVCDIVKKKKGVYQPFFDNFYPFVKESFNNNYSKFIEFADKKFNDTEVQNKVFKTGFYNMNIILMKIVVIIINLYQKQNTKPDAELMKVITKYLVVKKFITIVVTQYEKANI